jgi:hypothetical protein
MEIVKDKQTVLERMHQEDMNMRLVNSNYQSVVNREECLWLAKTYHENYLLVYKAAETLSPEHFLGCLLLLMA